MNGRSKLLAAAFNPLHRAAERTGQVWNQNLFGIELPFGAKTPADLRGNDLQAVFRHTEGLRQQRAYQMRNLR
jgi:hypothetical protein